MKYLVAILLTFAACTLPQPPDIPLLTPPIPTQTVFLPQTQECVEVISLAAILDTPVLPPPPKRQKPLPPVKVPTPAQVVQDAAKAARVLPDKTGYFAGSGEYTYVYQPAKVYTVLLSNKAATFILLPPGEVMIAGLYLPETFEVTTKRAGTDVLAYDVLSIRPTEDKGEIQSAIVTKSGRRYLLHLVVGAVGMLAVTWEVPAIHAAPEPTALVLPRPQP